MVGEDVGVFVAICVRVGVGVRVGDVDDLFFYPGKIPGVALIVANNN